MEMTKLSCEKFLAELASKAPTPGGGGTAALVGAAGVALGNMVGNLTTGKKKYAAVEADIQALNTKADFLRKELEALVQADADAFAPLAAAYGLPKDTPEQAAHKAAVLEKALDAACAVPLEVMEKCAEGIALVEEYAAKGSVMAVSDAGCAAALCKAALQAASLNVFINTKLMADRERAAALDAKTDKLLTKLSCEKFLAELASKAPTPGGGGTAALVGAAGVALGNMVGNLTTGKKKYAAVEADIQALNTKADFLRKELEALVQADADAFAPLAAAYGLPKDTPEQAAHKAAVLEKALDAACAVPLEVMEKCAEGIALVEEYAAKGSVMAVSDAGCAAALCKAALQAASLNVFINTKLMADRERAAALDAKTDKLLDEFVSRADAVFASVTNKLRNK